MIPVGQQFSNISRGSAKARPIMRNIRCMVQEGKQRSSVKKGAGIVAGAPCVHFCGPGHLIRVTEFVGMSYTNSEYAGVDPIGNPKEISMLVNLIKK